MKKVVLALLAVVSFASPITEAIVTGQVETFSTFGLVETAVSLVLLFTWYHLDKREHDYRAGTLMNGGVLVAAVIALPIYFFRSRGWKRGATAVGLAALYLALALALGELGETLGLWLARR